MKAAKIIILLIIAFILSSCTAVQDERLPEPRFPQDERPPEAKSPYLISASRPSSEEVAPTNDPGPYGIFCGDSVPYDSYEYSRILNEYLYGDWVISKILIEPAETMDKKVQDIIIGIKISFTSTGIANDFTEEKKTLAKQYEVLTELNNPKYNIEIVNLWRHFEGYRYESERIRDLDVYDSHNVRWIRAYDQDNSFWFGLGASIIIADQHRLIVEYGKAFWELNRL